jgi:hypothetical protein
VSVSNPTQTTLDVSWTAAKGTSAYRVSWVESPGGRKWVSAPPDYPGTFVHLTGLTANSTYTVTVTPYNDAGTGTGASGTGKTSA